MHTYRVIQKSRTPPPPHNFWKKNERDSKFGECSLVKGNHFMAYPKFWGAFPLRGRSLTFFFPIGTLILSYIIRKSLKFLVQTDYQYPKFPQNRGVPRSLPPPHDFRTLNARDSKLRNVSRSKGTTLWGNQNFGVPPERGRTLIFFFQWGIPIFWCIIRKGCKKS